MHTKVLKISFVRCLALLGALLTILTTLAQAASSGRAPSIHAFYRFEIHNSTVVTSGGSPTASAQGTLAFDLSATGALSAP